MASPSAVCMARPPRRRWWRRRLPREGSTRPSSSAGAWTPRAPTPRLGKSQYLVAEADESDRSFLKLSPILAVVTNIDREHMDCYRDMEDVRKTFLEFMERVPFYGMIVGCNDDPILKRLFPRVHRRVSTYGITRGSDFLVRLAPRQSRGAVDRPENR